MRRWPGPPAHLRTHGAATLHDAAVTAIAQIEAWPVNVPLEATYLMAPGTYPGMSRTVVRLTTIDGLVGLGESPSPHDATDVYDLAPSLVGRDADAVRAELGRHELPAAPARGDGRVLVCDALAGVEIALWDIAGREAREPVHVLLGGAVRTEIPLTEYFAYRPGREERPEDVAAFCARMVDEHDSPWFEGKVAVRPLDEDVRLVRAVREAIGSERVLRLDANMGWRLKTAERALGRLAEYDVANVEEPVSSFAELAELRRSSPIPFSAHAPDLAGAAALGVPESLVLGLAACGGVEGTRRFAAACDKAGIGFWFYGGDLGIATAASLHVAAATASLDLPSQSLLRWYGDDVIAEGPFAPERGTVPVPVGPGLGVTLDEQALRRAVERYARDGEYHLYSAPPLPHY